MKSLCTGCIIDDLCKYENSSWTHRLTHIRLSALFPAKELLRYYFDNNGRFVLQVSSEFVMGNYAAYHD